MQKRVAFLGGCFVFDETGVVLCTGVVFLGGEKRGLRLCRGAGGGFAMVICLLLFGACLLLGLVLGTLVCLFFVNGIR